MCRRPGYQITQELQIGNPIADSEIVSIKQIALSKPPIKRVRGLEKLGE